MQRKILILNQNYSVSQKVFQNAPNCIRACLDFQHFPGVAFPGLPTEMGEITISATFWAPSPQNSFLRAKQVY